MKTLKLDHGLAQAVLRGEKTTTWRMYDEKNLSVNDHIELVDKVDPGDMSTWRVIGTAVIDQVTEKRLKDINELDARGHEAFPSTESLYKEFQSYYGSDVGPDSPIKIIRFTFTAYPDPQQIANRVSPPQSVKLFADGGSRGNPGHSASGYVLMDGQDTVIKKSGVYLGVTTNNQAEYQALKLGLEEAQKLGAREVAVFMDSLLVINQMKGIFKVKNRDLWPIHESIKHQVRLFKSVTFTHVPREFNKLADAEVNETLDAELAQVRAANGV